MAAQTTNYQCPACTGPLHFDGEKGMLTCDYCESVFSVEEVEAYYKAKNEQAEEAFVEEEKKKEEAASKPKPSGDEWDASEMSEDWGKDASHLKVYNCTSCGAELICDDTTAATSCPYCGNPTVIPGQFSGAYKPEYVIPFKVKKEQAVAALKMHYCNKKLLPNAFKEENHIQEVKGIYVPFWLFDGEAKVEVNGPATKSHMIKDGEYMITVTEYYDLYRRGRVKFQKVPVDASSRMADDLMDSIEPYDYNELKPFSMGYLPGFFADKYDVSVEQCASRADTRSKRSAYESVARTLTSFEGMDSIKNKVNLKRGNVHYALLPVWLLTTNWNGERYTFAMNGQTGKFVGDLPMDKQLYRKWHLIYGGIIGAMIYVMMWIMALL